MPADGAPFGPDKLSLIVFSGEFAKVHYALALAASAVAMGRQATLFFTMAACRTLMKPNAEGDAPWRALPAGDGDGTAGERDNRFAAAGLATFEDLLQSCAALGVRFLVCEMGLKAMDIAVTDLRPDIGIEQAGIVTFLADASPNGLLSFL